MTLQAPNNRKDYRFDLTRWNRAGLSRFDYVDGDAAVWLEELRTAMLGLYLRGASIGDRRPETWRDIFLKKPVDRELSLEKEELESLALWKEVFWEFPAGNIESRGERNERLLKQYAKQSPDYAWEIMRAFARASHVLLGHVDAYTNEGYLRTATQWENVRKLAAMVNYQPTPPASATTTVALEIEPGKGVIEIGRGLAMKYAVPAGGAPLVFETLKSVLVHEELSAARTTDWNYNRDPLDMSTGKTTHWIAPEKAELSQGGLAVITYADSSHAVVLGGVVHDVESETAILSFDDAPTPAFGAETGGIRLLSEPDGAQMGLPRSEGDLVVIKVDAAGSYAVRSVVELRSGQSSSSRWQGVVVEAANGYLSVHIGSVHKPTGTVEIEAFTPFAAGGRGLIETPMYVEEMYFRGERGSDRTIVEALGSLTYTERVDEDGDSRDVPYARVFNRPAQSTGFGYARLDGTRVDVGDVIGDPPIAGSVPGKTVRFEGAPPKSLTKGDWYVSRAVGGTTLMPLRVVAIRQETDVYYVRFQSEPLDKHHKTEFFGPMTRTLRPVNFDRDQRDAIQGGTAELKGLSAPARDLVKPGRDVIVVYDGVNPKVATVGVISSVVNKGEALEISMLTEASTAGWKAGWTSFYLNTVDVSHGETKDPKVLGSGDAEQKRQDFQFKITDVSFIPSNAASTGVAPDMDVTVDGVKWEFRDYGDPRADESDAWSVVLNEDDTLQVHFRRRLPSGTNNVSVSRHRVGVGASGTGVPPWAFERPMKKNRFVTAIVQPFATAGGADREPVSDIRRNAPSKLATNGRAVSLRDFELLCSRHSSVWQAKARVVVGAGSSSTVDIVVVPASGGDVSATLEGDLVDFIQSRALPDAIVEITPYEPLQVTMHVRVFVDTDRYVKSDVKDAVEAELKAEFALRKRGLGQPLYIAEILAAAESVTGVSSATVRDFACKPGPPEPLREAKIGSRRVAIYPTEEQVLVVASLADVVVEPEALSP